MTTDVSPSDAALIAEYRAGSQSAFTTLVSRNIDAVYSTACRCVKDRHLAEDVTQAVFLIFSQKAASLPHGVVIPAWLHRTTRYCALNALRLQSSRKRHERRAAEMIQSSASNSADTDDSPRLSAILDEAVNKLPDLDRKIIILRFFHAKAHETIAAELSLSPAATTKRTQRALARLRQILARHGHETTLSTLAGAMTGQAIDSAPVHLLSQISANLASPANIAASTTAIATGAARLLLWAQIKTLALIAALLLLITAGAVAITLALASTTHNSHSTAQFLPIRQSSASSAIQSPAQPLAATAQHPTSQPAAWRPAFDAVYTLADSEVIRNIPPPYIPARDGFIHDLFSTDDLSFNNGRVADPPLGQAHPPAALFLLWNPQTQQVDRWIRANDRAWRIQSLTVNLVGLTPDQVIEPHAFENIPLPGDWVIRKGATVEQKLAAFQAIATHTPAAFTVQKKQIPRDVIVAHGTYKPSDWPTDIISVTLDTDPGHDRQAGDIKFYLRELGNMLGRPVVNEWTDSDDAHVQFTIANQGLSGLSKEAKTKKVQKLLDQIAPQLNIQLTLETRPIPTWIFTPTTPK